MRLWSIHPSYLDRQGLIALWRETLLAQKVLAGKTRGYRHHPQLIRFRETDDPLSYIGSYLARLVEEASSRGYQFDSSKILKKKTFRKNKLLPVTRGQLKYESQHLLRKLETRDPARFKNLTGSNKWLPHPIFKVVPGGVADWEKQVAD